MKVLVLSLYNKNEFYDKMLDAQKTYIHKNNIFDVYFITFDENISEYIKIIDDIIYVKGKESYINILYKTFESLNYLINILHNDYDYIIRTNISTILHLENLYNYLSNLPRTNVYTGGNLEILKWQLMPYEISDNKQDQRNAFFGLKYIQGIGIILSYDVIKKLLEIKNSIEYDIVDDVKLGLLIRDYLPETYENIDKINLAKVTFNSITSESVFIRNRTNNNRFNDIHNIRFIVNDLYEIEYPNYDKIIHITYKNLDKLENIKNQWVSLNPNYTVELYDDKRCLEFLDINFGKKYCDIFNYIKDGAIKCDFFRLCILFIHGGIYVDADVKPLIPLEKYIDDDIDFGTCISYNFKKTNSRFNYNPHFIVTKKYNKHLYNTIKKYEIYYDNKIEYSYWEWSICALFNIDINFEITSTNNKFMYNSKKYQFLIEKALKDNIYYDFTNIRDENNMLKFEYVNKCLCSYDNVLVLDNFSNKYLLN